MRVSAQLSQQIGLQTMASQEARMLHTMQQLGSGRRVLTPADDPLAASQAVTVAQTESINQRLADNRSIAMRNLTTQEQVLTEVTTMMQGALTRVIEAGNGTYSDTELQTLANTLRETRESLLGQANATNGNGQYVFSGNQGDVPPYQQDGIRADVAGERKIQVSQTRQMATSDTAGNVFGRVSPGVNGYFGQMGTPFNGSVTMGGIVVTDPTLTTGSYRADFADDGNGGFTVTVTDADGKEMLAAQPFESGKPLEFGGIRVAFSGTPADGDSMLLQSTKDADIDLFETLDHLISALEAGTATPRDQASLNNALATANRKLNLHMDNILTVRASGGARMNELTALDDDGDNRKLNYAAQLMDLEQVDIREASSNLASYRVGLEAAQLAYMKIQGLSLFNRGG